MITAFNIRKSIVYIAILFAIPVSCCTENKTKKGLLNQILPCDTQPVHEITTDVWIFGSQRWACSFGQWRKVDE